MKVSESDNLSAEMEKIAAPGAPAKSAGSIATPPVAGDVAPGYSNQRRRDISSNLRVSLWKHPLATPALIFGVAFILRYLYNAVFMEHRIAHFGDAYNFLRSGTCLLEAAASSHNPSEFLAKIFHAAPPQTQLLQSMTSMKLTDRLMIDGPVYPGYLAIVQWLAGIDPVNPIFDARTVQISLCNSFIDSLACVLLYFCGRLGFDRKTAATAGLLFAVYPAAIINTQHCYSEPFSYFLLIAWTALTLYVLLRHTNRWQRPFAWSALGVCSGLIMLSKPAFVLLPPLVALAVISFSIWRILGAQRRSSNQSMARALMQITARLARQAAFGLIGLALVLMPWMFFNKAATGQYSVFVNRVPSFNIFHGNQVGTDGWRCYPFYGCFPGDSKLVMQSLAADARKDPGLFVGLQFKKMARLWSGVWNEYHYSLFGIPLEWQSLFHQLLLIGGITSLSLLLVARKNKTLSRKFSAGLVLGAIAVFHFVYIPFEAISRYAITAMPAVVLLCAYLLVESWRNGASRRALVFLTVSAAPLLLIVSASGDTANLVASFTPPAMLPVAPWVATAIAGLAFVLVFHLMASLLDKLARQCQQEQKTAAFSANRLRLVPALFCALAASSAGIYALQSHDWKEWACSLNSHQSVQQTISVPANTYTWARAAGAKTAFVLMDINSDILAPPVNVALNGVRLNESPVPLAQFEPNNTDILECLAIQGEGMSLDMRTFRNWWVVPFPIAQLRAGTNDIRLSSEDDHANAKVYGDFCSAKSGTETSTQAGDGTSYLPSLRSFSYTKGFTTFDHRDPRVFEKLTVQGSTAASVRLVGNDGTTRDSNDLSETAGKQFGRYRIRLIVPIEGHDTTSVFGTQSQQQIPATASAKDIGASSVSAHTQTAETAGTGNLETLVLVPSGTPQTVLGQNPCTFVPPTKEATLPENMPKGTRFTFSCRIRTVKGSRPSFVSLPFLRKQTVRADSFMVFKLAAHCNILVTHVQNSQLHRHDTGRNSRTPQSANTPAVFSVPTRFPVSKTQTGDEHHHRNRRRESDAFATIDIATNRLQTLDRLLDTAAEHHQLWFRQKKLGLRRTIQNSVVAHYSGTRETR